MMERLQVYITEKQDERLQKMKDETGLKKAEIVRRAIEHYFNTNSEKQEGDKK